MSGRALATALTAAVVAILVSSFGRLILNAKEDAAKFDSRIAAGRDFMNVSRAINEPNKCDRTLVPLLRKWDAVNGVGDLQIEGVKVSIVPNPESITTPDRGVGARMRFKTAVSDRDLPLRFLVQPDGKISKCMIDVEAVRFSLAAMILPTERCMPATNTSNWYVRCPAGTFLIREVTPGVLRCCPWEG